MGKSKMTALTGLATKSRSWRPTEVSEVRAMAAEVVVNTYLVIEAVYVLEFSIMCN